MRTLLLMPLCAFLGSLTRCAVASEVDDEGTAASCLGASLIPRSGGAMLQTTSRGKFDAAPPLRRYRRRHRRTAATKAMKTKESDRGKDADSGLRGPADDLLLSLSNRAAAVDERFTKLEREALSTRLNALKNATNAISVDNDAANGRIAAAEDTLGALVGVVSENDAALRAELESVKSQFEGLGEMVGQHWSAMLGVSSERDDPQGDSALVDRVASLNGRCTTLEEESGIGRQELRNQLIALAKQIAGIQTGGVASLQNSTDRVSSVEAQVASLAAVVDDHVTELTEGLMALKIKIDSVGKEFHRESGAMLHQEQSGPSSVAATLGVEDVASSREDSGTSPLASQIASLEERAGVLEAKSNEGRADLQAEVDKLTTLLASIKEGSVKSLAHIVLRVGAMEIAIGTVTAVAEAHKVDMDAETEDLQAMLTAVEGLSGEVRGA